MDEEIVKADVLCIGGGIAGLMAAIRAGELGAKVVVVEKSNTLSSGAGGRGNDHFECYIPEIHGPDKEAFIQELLHGQRGEWLQDVDMARVQFSKAFDIVKLWDSWGIPMRYKGRWEFAGHTFPGRTFTHLKYAGRMQKTVLTNQAVERGVEINNRVMAYELLHDGRKIIGAVGAHTREDRVIVYLAKSVILGTGSCSRLYPSPGARLLFCMNISPSCTGDGRAMAYRAGAELENAEMARIHNGPKYFCMGGPGTWVGVLRDSHDNPLGTFLTKPDRKYSDMIMEVNKLAPEQYTNSGKGPVYMDCRGITDEDYEYMMHWMRNEGRNTALFDHFEAEGVDLRKNPIEFITYHMGTQGSIVTNLSAETTLTGLFAAGDETSRSISNAATFGWIGGENAANYSKMAEAPDIERARTKIEEVKTLIDQIRGRENGPGWREVNIAMQQTMHDYAGSVRNKEMLDAGLIHLGRLKEKARTTLTARGPHELGRCLEVLNLLDIGEIVFIAAGDRKETRGLHVRPDYPFTNPLFNRYHIIKKTNDKPVTAWREKRYQRS